MEKDGASRFTGGSSAARRSGGAAQGQQRKRWLDSITDLVDMEFEQIPGDSEGQESLGHKELDTG